jgi:hypothetical protein
MTAMLVLLGVLASVAAAARSTYSPCGLSMLSSITPFGERARGHRYYATSAWFVAGAAVGGATLGAGGAALAALVALGRPSPDAVAGAGAALALMAAAVDAGCFGEVLPVIRRQVDDAWLAKYRPWLYGAGFGWQIGVGFATYVMTAAVPLVVALGALTGSVPAAVVLGALFGTARGLTVFLTAPARTPARLRALHAWVDAAGPAVRWGVVGTEAGIVAVLGAGAAGSSPPLWLAAAAVGLTAAAGGMAARRLVPVGA